MIVNFADVAEAMFKVTAYVMHFAPIGVFAMIAYTVGSYGIEMLIPLGELIVAVAGATASLSVLWPSLPAPLRESIFSASFTP